MSENKVAVYEAWKKFISKENTNPKDVSDYVLRSWKSSAEGNVDPLQPSSTKILSGIELQRTLDKHSDLIKAALPIMRMTSISTRSTNSITLLSSADGILLAVEGDPSSLSPDERDCNKVGSLCSENQMGSRAVTLCLKENKPLSLCGPEHYCRYFHTTSCYAAPIYDENGKPLGSISVSGWTTDWHPHTLALVSTAAETITTRLREASLSFNQQRLNSMISSIYDSLPEAILALDTEGRITHANTNAATLIQLPRQEIKGQYFIDLISPSCQKEAAEYIAQGKPSSCDIQFANLQEDQMCLCRIRPTRLPSNEWAGMTLTFFSHRQLLDMTARMGGNCAVYDFHHIKGNSNKLQQCVKIAQKVAPLNSRILLTGESGTGKELFAQAIHNNSSVQKGPFVAISCAAIPRDLIESELFGYVGGAFTGARKKGAIGKFELASEGTLFLDEVNSLPLDMQSKLLRAIQQGQILRIGATSPTQVKTRIIAATNKDLMDCVRENNFREDLYYRLNVVEIPIPPLRERTGDIPILVEHIVRTLCKEKSFSPVEISQGFLNELSKYQWPGNIRELYNICERAMVFADGDTLKIHHLPSHISQKEIDVSLPPTGTAEDNFLKLLKETIKRNNGNMTKVANELAISRSTLYRKMAKHGISKC